MVGSFSRLHLMSLSLPRSIFLLRTGVPFGDATMGLVAR